MNDTTKIGQRLVDLCRNGQFLQAVDELYADDITSTEAMAPPGMQAKMQGKPAVRGKNQWWQENHTVHSMKIDGPFPHGDRFIVNFMLDVTGKAGPMAGKRMQMHEAALYTVKNGKVVEEAFFYAGPGDGQ